jgi:hypothetical protein
MKDSAFSRAALVQSRRENDARLELLVPLREEKKRNLFLGGSAMRRVCMRQKPSPLNRKSV